MKKLVALLLTGVIAVSFVACSSKAPEKEAESTTKGTEIVTNETTTTAAVEEEEPKAEAVEVKIGESIKLDDFVKISLDETDIKADIKRSIKNGNVTRTTGPDKVDGQKYLYIRGTIKNLSKKELPVYDFFLGQFDVDGYQYDISASDCTVIDAEGSSESSVPPLAEYSFTMYAAIPNEIANNNKSITYRFGFYDEFANEELARNQAFEDDPISLCPYQYSVVIK